MIIHFVNKTKRKFFIRKIRLHNIYINIFLTNIIKKYINNEL